MAEVNTTVALPDADPASTFAVLADFARYPEFTQSVLSVEVHMVTPQNCWSQWQARFRDGILKWKERDEINATRMIIDFTQTEGDLAEFVGQWQVRKHGSGCKIYFQAQFDLGMPTLADLLNPVAERALLANIVDIASGAGRTAEKAYA